MKNQLLGSHFSSLKDTVRLFGIARELDETIKDFAYLADRFQEFHPANNGDISQVLSSSLGEQLVKRFDNQASPWYFISEIEKLSEIRNDGRLGYRGEGVKNNPKYSKEMKLMGGRVMLISCTGSDIPNLLTTLNDGHEGKLLNLVEVNRAATKIRLIYGNREYGTIPSIETHIHILSNALSIGEGIANPSTVHVHPYNMVSLGRHKKIEGDFEKYNAALYSQNGVVKNVHPGLVGIAKYCPSGSAQLALASLSPLKKHGFVLWMNHGATVRAETIRKGYIQISYLDDAARYAIDALQENSFGLPFADIQPFLKEKGLEKAYAELFSA